VKAYQLEALATLYAADSRGMARVGMHDAAKRYAKRAERYRSLAAELRITESATQEKAP